MDRRTYLAVDSDGNFFVGINGENEDIHSEKDLVELFIAENKVFGVCEVVEV